MGLLSPEKQRKVVHSFMIFKCGLFVNIPVRWKVVSISISAFEANNFQLHKKKELRYLTTASLIFITLLLQQQQLKIFSAFVNLLIMATGYLKTRFIKQSAVSPQSKEQRPLAVWWCWQRGAKADTIYLCTLCNLGLENKKKIYIKFLKWIKAFSLLSFLPFLLGKHLRWNPSEFFPEFWVNTKQTCCFLQLSPLQLFFHPNSFLSR